MRCYSLVRALEILYKAFDIHEEPNEEALLVLFSVKLGKTIHISICLNVEKAKCKLAHFTNKNVHTVQDITDSSDHNRFVCSICNQEPFRFVQMCAETRSSITTLCIIHYTNESLVCNVPLH